VTAPATAPSQIVYAARLPSPVELSNAAAAQGLTVERIEQTEHPNIGVYKFPNGQTSTVAYQLLPAAGVPPGRQS